MNRFLARSVGYENLSEKIDRVFAETRGHSEWKVETESQFETIRDRVDQLEKHILDLLVEVSALRMDFAREFEELQKAPDAKIDV